MLLPRDCRGCDGYALWSGEALAPARISQEGIHLIGAVLGPGGQPILATRQGRLLALEGGSWAAITPRHMESDNLTRICITSDDRLCLVSEAGRLLTCDLLSERWLTLVPEGGPLWSAIQALCPAPEGGLWLGTMGGVVRWTGEGFADYLSEGAGQALDTVTAVEVDERGHLWVGSGADIRGALERDGSGWRLHREPEGVGELHVHCIHRDGSGGLWFSLLGDEWETEEVPGGVAALRNGDWRRYTTEDGLPDNRCYGLMEGPEGGPWVATRRGVARLSGERWVPVGQELPTAFQLRRAPDGRVWCSGGPHRPGLHRLVDGRWEPMEDPLLADAHVYDLAWTADGWLWVTAREGIFAFDGQQSFEVTREPGIPRNHWPIRIDSQEDIWLGSLGWGLMRFRPADIAAPTITGLTVHVDSRRRAAAVHWSSRDRWDVTPPRRLRYQFQLDEEEWSPPSEATHADLVDLAPGQHRLRVRALDLAGNVQRVPEECVLTVSSGSAARLMLGLLLALTALSLLAVMTRRRRERRLARDRERELLSRSERHYRTLVERADMILSRFDGAGRLVYISPQIEELTGRRAEELIRTPGLLEQLVHPEDRERFARTGEGSDAGGPDQPEFRLRQADGQWRWIYPRRGPARGGGGDQREREVVWVDISERRALEDAVRRSEERFRGIVETSTEGVWILDVDGRTTYANERMASILGVEKGGLVGRSLDEFLEGASMAVAGSAVERSGAGEPQQCEVQLRRADGEQASAILGVSRIGDSRGEGCGSLVMVADITPHRRAEDALLRSQKWESLGAMAGGVAHDFSNLLMAMLGKAHLALGELSEGSEAQRHLHGIEDAAMHARELCQQLLAYGGSATFELQSVDLSELCADMMRLLRASTDDATRILADLRPVPLIEADPVQLRQVILNLVLNATESFRDRTGTIQLRTDCGHLARAELDGMVLGCELPEGDYAHIETTDDGCGMDLETIGKIFDPFFSTKFTGRGLGLAAVLGLVRAHKGALEVSSEPGRGTTFRVHLPAVPRPAAASAPGAGERPWRGAGTILVVDDDSAVCAAAEGMLEALGFEVLSATSGAEAVDLCRDAAGEIRAVLLDLIMPGMNGVEVFRAIRDMRGDARVVFASGHPEYQAFEHFREEGASGFLMKPFSIQALGGKLREVLEGQAR